MQRPSHAGLRHLALHARRLDEMKQFYVDLLGFAIEWEPDPDNIYLSSGTDNLALHRSTDASRLHPADTDVSVGAARHDDEAAMPARTGDSVLDHLGLIVRSADDVDRWADFLEGHGVIIDAKPRTHRDGARSCYFRDPDGNRVQIIHHPPISDRL
jgi:catechol 2,3-dioxygenase-like lactoylglutathione lyase family enzyme